MFGKYIFAAILFAIVCHLTQSAVTPAPINNDVPPYGDCDTKHQCFGLGADKSKDCVADKNCIVLLSTVSTDSGAKFRLFWTRDEKSTDSWVAAGLSLDDKMGDDSVTEFIIKADKTVTSSQGVTLSGDKYGVKDVVVKGITDVKTSYTNGLLTGEWTRTTDTTVDKFDFNIQTTKYYILLAYGPIDDKGAIKAHTAKYVSPTSVTIESKPSDPSSTTVAPKTTVAPASTSVAPSGSTVPATPAPSTAGPTTKVIPLSTTASGSTASPGTSTTGQTSSAPVTSTSATVKPPGTTSNTTDQPTTADPGNSATTATLSLISAIIVSIILITNNKN